MNENIPLCVSYVFVLVSWLTWTLRMESATSCKMLWSKKATVLTVDMVSSQNTWIVHHHHCGNVKSHFVHFGLVLIIKANKVHYISTLFDKELYIFWTDLLSIIRSLNTVFTAIDICHTSDVNCLLARSVSSWPRQQTVNITSVTNTSCCEYSIKTPDDGR
jgi:hypothetical protein